MIANEVITTTAGQVIKVADGNGTPTDARTIMFACITTTAHIGGASVTTSSGVPLTPGTLYSLDLRAGESLYVISQTTGALRVLGTRAGSATEVGN